MKRVLLTTPPREAFLDEDGVGGNPWDKTDVFQGWTCALDPADRLSVTCPAISLRFLKANVPDVEILEHPTWSEYLAALEAERWDVVGLSFKMWGIPAAIEMAKAARAAGVKEIWAGNYGVLTGGLEPYFDKIIAGPGENALHEYLYGRPVQAIRHPPLLGVATFRGMSSKVGFLYSKRGCNIGCTFCSTPLFNAGEAPISLESMNEVLDVYQAERVSQVIIYDETFFLDPDAADRVVSALERRDLPWTCLTRADRIRGRVGELTDRGMDGAILGIESFRNSILVQVRKRDDAAGVQEAIRELNRYGRRAMGTFIVGFEGETPETIRADIQQLAEYELYVCQITLLTPFPGTPMARSLARKGYRFDPDCSKYDLYHLVWNHPAMSPAEARELLAWGQRLVNRPDYMERKIRDLVKERWWRSLQRGRAQLEARQERVS